MRLPAQTTHTRCDLIAGVCPRIRSAMTEYDIIKTFKEILPAYDLKGFIFANFRFGDETGDTVKYGINNWDSELLYLYAGNEALGRNPVLRQLRATVLPRTLRRRDILQAEGNNDCREIHLALIDAGFETLAFIPARSSTGQSGGISLSGRRQLLSECELMQLAHIAQQAFEHVSVNAPANTVDRSVLSDRERECLELTAQGLSIQKIAASLGITTHTVNYHISNINRKLRAQNKSHALAIAIRNRYISL